ncbi:MAG: exopolysaccharide biosynthesis polyprenyl glycosylphosphotransferase [Candidatus Binataceae bacterium]
MLESDYAADASDSGLQRGRLLWEKRLLLAFGDGIAVGISFVVAFNLRSAEIRHEFFAIPRAALLITLATWYACAEVVDGYQLISAVSLRAAFTSVASAILLTFIALLGEFFIFPYRITRPTILLWVPLAAALVLSWRTFYQQVFARTLFAGNLVVIADRPTFERVWAEASNGLPAVYHVLEVIEPARRDLEEHLTRMAHAPLRPDVLIGVPGEVSPELLRAIVACCERGVRVRFLSDLFEEMTGRLLLDQLGYSWLMSLPIHTEASRIYMVCKRALDIVVGVVGVALLAIVYPLVAMAIKLEDRGPVFYRQTRVGRFGSRFEMLKLRTMYTEGKIVERQTANDDSRITFTGRMLRPLHLDELPQAINVLRGEMSVVGPRPEQPSHAGLLREEIELYDLRLSVRPGWTGWAQVNYGYGAGLEGARRKLSYDLYYIRHRSFGLDLLILARTVRAILSLRGR